MKRGESLHPRLIAFLCAMVVVAGGQEQWHNHPELEWQTFETEHFLIHFHQGTERSAREAATVAEKVYGPVTAMYNYKPPAKTHLIIKDVDDVSNGLAYYFDNKIEIWSRPLDFDLRGSHRWMQNVITHEFVHIVQLATAMKFSRRVPSLYFQALGYEEEKREDVLYGYPNVLVSYPYPGVNIPPWFAEGVAQFMYPGAHYDFWDSHREMILRDRVRHDNLLSLPAMNSFGKRGIGNESVYNQGFAFVRYLAGRFGEEVLGDVSRMMAAPLAVSISRGLEKVTGTSGTQLYREWKAELEEYYRSGMARVKEHEVTGDILISAGSTNIHPVWHPTDRRFAFLSNQRSDFFGQTALYVYDLTTGKTRHVAEGVSSAPCWSADGRMLYYTRRSKPGKTGARWLDLFAYNLETRKEKRLTHGERATSPVLIDSSRSIAYLTVRDGSSNVRQLDLISKEITTLTDFDGGEYIHSLTCDSADSLLIFDVTLNHGRELFRYSLANGEVAPYSDGSAIGHLEADTRDPVHIAGGLLISTDASGVFNLLQLSEDGVREYVTNVTGGAFMPSANGQGEVLYSLYQDGGYKIALLSNPLPIDAEQVGVPTERRDAWSQSPREGPDVTLTPQPFEETMSRPFVLPRLMVDYGTVKPGLYFYTGEVLDRLFIFGGTSFNMLKDTDNFLLFEFRKFHPTVYTEVYAVRRHIRQDLNIYDWYQGTDDLRFNLLEAIVGLRFPWKPHRFWAEVTHSRYRMRIFRVVQDYGGGGFAFDYYLGTSAAARWQLYGRRPEFGGDMFPTKGFEVEAELRAEKNDLAEDFTISKKYSTPVTMYEPNNTLRLRLNFKTYAALHRPSRITAAYEATLGWLSNAEVDTFFYFFGGGAPGLRGFTYYDSTVQGPNLMVHTLTVRLPVILEHNIPLGQLTLQNISVGLVAQLGDGFKGSWLTNRYQSSLGMEVRLSGYSFYVFPFALAYEVHRPMGGRLDEEYRHYISLLFDF